VRHCELPDSAPLPEIKHLAAAPAASWVEPKLHFYAMLAGPYSNLAAEPLSNLSEL